VRAVNLIPSEAGQGGRGGASIGPWALFAVLGLLLAGVLGYVLTNNQLVDRRAQLATLQTQAHAIQAQADAARPYREFAALAQARVETVRQLGASRFDWHRAFAELAQVMPSDVWLTSLLGTVAPGVSVDGAGSGDTGSLRSALPNPAIELTGCTTGNDEVARLISRLRLMTGVVRVALSSTTKDDSSTGGGGGGGAGGGDCRYGHAGFPQFGIVVFFAPLPAVPAPTAPSAAGATAGTPASSAAPAAGASPSTTPAASTTPAPAAGAAASSGGNGNGSETR
jgi:Tfp pilus assembly protein PilN